MKLLAKLSLKGEYQVQQFCNGDRISSSAFPELTLTAEQIFAAGQ